MDLLAHFSMHKTPFTREIQTEEFLGFPFADEAFEGLLHAVSQHMSCALIAPAGTGKTALLRRLRGALPEARYHVRYVKVTSLSKRDMCREIAAACGLPPAGTYPSLVRKLQQHWDDGLGTDGVRPVLILDEGHDLRPDVLAILRILTNFQMDSRLVLSVVLAGQPPLGTMLSRDDLDPRRPRPRRPPPGPLRLPAPALPRRDHPVHRAPLRHRRRRHRPLRQRCHRLDLRDVPRQSPRHRPPRAQDPRERRRPGHRDRR